MILTKEMLMGMTASVFAYCYIAITSGFSTF